ncbi:MAG: DUF302 domain-containing protein [Candidatus Thioglobus sp.]|nr:DUF302 domain-containing protein [Candidatus Thioglobus pontius]MBL6984267.1 DUF302 domain-containing protein [Candidatus Thioglobus sp.]
MNSTFKHFLFITFILLIKTSSANTVINTAINNPYKDVRSNLIDAIEEKALNISKIYHASDMLNRTKDSVQNAKNIYQKAEIIEFCSAKISHQLVSANHLNISACPFKIALYSLVDNPNKTHVVYTKLTPLDLKSAPPTTQANKLIQSLVESAAW